MALKSGAYLRNLSYDLVRNLYYGNSSPEFVLELCPTPDIGGDWMRDIVRLV